MTYKKNCYMEKNKSTKDFITSKTFRDIADLVYSETVSLEEFDRLDNQNLTIVSTTNTKDHKSITYKKNIFDLHDNDIIFSNTDLIEDLFFHLKKISNLKNITLISSESDKPVNKKLFNKKPDFVERWFSTNILYEDSSLISIPLGLANSYSKKNINKQNLENIEFLKFDKQKQFKMLINFRVNTNFSERRKIYDKFKNFDWVVVDSPENTIENYIQKIKENDLVMCPWGNGIDTHRVFETLYLGAVPVIKYHPTYKYLDDLPAILVKDLRKVDFKILNQSMKKLSQKEFNMEKLTSSWWENLIRNENEKIFKIRIYESKSENKELEIKYKNKLKFKSKEKKIKYFIRRFRKFLNI